MASGMKIFQPLMKVIKIYFVTFIRIFEAYKVRWHYGYFAAGPIEEIKKKWAKAVLEVCCIELEVSGSPLEQNCIMVGNHLSYLDIPLVMSCAPTTFVAKKQLEKWPGIGWGGRIIGPLFVDRSSVQSKRKVANQIADSVKVGKRVITVFPSGTTDIEEEKIWRKGVFRLACDHDISVQPFRLWFEPARKAAYIDKDMFLPHLCKLLFMEKIRAKLEFHEPVKIHCAASDPEKWRAWSCDSRFRLWAN